MDFGDTLILYVTGAEFQDLNHDGARAPCEPGVQGIIVKIFDDPNTNGRVDDGEALLGSDTTDQYGYYVIGDLTPGLVSCTPRPREVGGIEGSEIPLSLEGSEISARGRDAVERRAGRGRRCINDARR